MEDAKKRQLKNTGHYLSLVVITYCFPFLTLPFFTRALTPEDYGILAMSGIFGLFLTACSNLGLVSVYQRNYFEYREDRTKAAALLYSTICFVIAFFLVEWGLSFLFRDKISMFLYQRKGMEQVFLIDGIGYFLVGLIQYYYYYFQNSEDAKSYGRYSIATMVITTAASFLLVVYLRIGVMGMVYAKLLGVGSIFLLLSVRFLRELPFAWDSVILTASLKLSLPLTPNIFSKMFMKQFDKYMINVLSTLGQVGIYNVGEKFAYTTFAFMTALDQVYIPHIYNEMFTNKKGGEAIGKYLTPFFYLSLFFCFAVAVFAEEVIVVLTPQPYHGAINIVMILSMSYALMFFGKQPQLFYAGKTKLLSVLLIFNMVMNVGFNFMLIYRFGAIGAAVSALAVGLIFTPVYMFFCQKHYRIEWEQTKLFALLGFFFSSICGLLFLRPHISYLEALGVKVVLFSIYVYMGFSFGIITKKRMRFVWDAVAVKLKSLLLKQESI